MVKIKQAFTVAAFNFRKWHKTPRIIMTFILAFTLCMLLTEKAIDFAYQHGTSMQIFEAFVWTFGDANSIMISSLLLLLIFADMPFLTAFTPYYLTKTTKIVWFCGQIIYIVVTVIIYMLFMLIATMLLSMDVSFAGNMWSDTGAMLAFSGAGANIALPVSIKTMIISYPFQCALNIFFLMLLYTTFLTLVMFTINIYKGKFWGILSVFIINVFGLLLNPQTFISLLNLQEAVEYKANVIVGWLSPLNQATYYMHNFGYDYLPTLAVSYTIFGALIIMCFVLSLKRIKKYNFMYIS